MSYFWEILPEAVRGEPIKCGDFVTYRNDTTQLWTISEGYYLNTVSTGISFDRLLSIIAGKQLGERQWEHERTIRNRKFEAIAKAVIDQIGERQRRRLTVSVIDDDVHIRYVSTVAEGSKLFRLVCPIDEDVEFVEVFDPTFARDELSWEYGDGDLDDVVDHFRKSFR